MNKSRYLPLLLLGVNLLFISACSSTPKQKLPSLLQQAERHNLAGVAAEAKERFLVAETEFAEAYRLFASVENIQGMVTTLINSSRVYRRQGNIERTDNVLKQAAKIISFSPDLETEFVFEKCKLALLKGDKDGALLWAEKGVSAATESDRARMLNLAATVHSRRGDHERWRESAEKALTSARSRHDRREEANALRHLGEAAFLDKRYHESLAYYESALPIDKDVAVPGRVYADLYALSLAAEALGDMNGGIEYLQRSADAAIADRNVKSAVESLDRLISLYRRTGNSEPAEKILRLKNTLLEKSAE